MTAITESVPAGKVCPFGEPAANSSEFLIPEAASLQAKTFLDVELYRRERRLFRVYLLFFI